MEIKQLITCDVHRILDFDCNKRLCAYCALCDAWICEECRPQITRRIRAAIKRKLEPGFRGDPKYIEDLKEMREF